MVLAPANTHFLPVFSYGGVSPDGMLEQPDPCHSAVETTAVNSKNGVFCPPPRHLEKTKRLRHEPHSRPEPWATAHPKHRNASAVGDVGPIWIRQCDKRYAQLVCMSSLSDHEKGEDQHFRLRRCVRHGIWKLELSNEP